MNLLLRTKLSTWFHSIQVPTNSLSSGMYFLKISDTSGKIKTAKFTKL
ncbi:MAG: T9SS type A sorting domain-containing protein [Saprospiraceae bacterium]|nr:T9SS type A sorting domain-containing protein [Saprospiraceae bacterium]